MLGGKIRSSKEKKREKKGGGETWLFMLVRSGCPIVLYSRGIAVMLGEY